MGNASGEVIIPWAARSIEFAWTNVNYRDEDKIAYQYRLVGYDSRWTPTPTMTVRFRWGWRNGNYDFHVRAVSDSGIASAPANFTFTILAPWWQTTLFKTVCGALLVGLMLSFWKLRAKRFAGERCGD